MGWRAAPWSMTTGGARLVRAGQLLADSWRRLWFDDGTEEIADRLAEAGRLYDSVAGRAAPGGAAPADAEIADAEVAATIAIGRSTIAAYEEALRRDPWDGTAHERLEQLEVTPDEPPPAGAGDPISRRPYGFAVLHEQGRISHSDWFEERRLFGTLSAARADADACLQDTGDLEREFLDGMMKLDLEIHRPGRPDLLLRVQGAQRGESLSPATTIGISGGFRSSGRLGSHCGCGHWRAGRAGRRVRSRWPRPGGPVGRR